LASALPVRGAAFNAGRAFDDGPPKRSSSVLAFDFIDFGMDAHMLHADGEPRIGSYDYGTEGGSSGGCRQLEGLAKLWSNDGPLSFVETPMRVSVTDAKAQLTELVRLAEAGDEVILTRHGKSAVRLVPIPPQPTAAEKEAIIERISMSASQKATPGPSAARSQDFLYNDETGLPE
jgi:prevent-host-death family protein